MKTTINVSLAAIVFMTATLASADPAPYPLPVNSRSQTAPPVVAYAGNLNTYRVTLTDGNTASPIVGTEVPFMAWATNNTAAVNSTGVCSVVSGTTGVFDVVFSPASVNFTAGRYIYEVGVKSNGVPRTYRQGSFQIVGSPVGGSVDSVTWTTNVDWSTFNWANLPSSIGASPTDTVARASISTLQGRLVDSVNGSTGAVTVATAAQGAKADTALQPAYTNGWTTTAHAAWLTAEADTNALSSLASYAATNGWKAKMYYYGTEDITITPTNAFTFDGAGTITAYNQAIGGLAVVVPYQINGVTVTNIGYECFKDKSITSVICPDSILFIGESAFDSCTSLETIDIPQCVSVGRGAFASCSSLETINLPKCSTIGKSAFSSCQSFISVYFGSTPPTLETTPFNGCTNTVYHLAGYDYGATFGGRPTAVYGPQLVSVTGGYMTNATFGGAVTIGGVARDTWPDSGTATIYATVSTSAATVVVAPNQTVYSVNLTSASVVSNDLSGISLDGQIAQWTERINFATTNALDSTFATNTFWACCVPSLTVTGTYVYACSTLDGVSVVRKQTFPSVHSPSAVSFVNGVAIGAEEVPPVLQSIRYGLAFATNNLGCLVGPYRGYKILLSVKLQSMSVVLNPAPYGGSLQAYNTSASIPFEMSWRNIGHDVLSGVVDCTVIDTTYRTIALVKIAGESYAPTVLGVTARILNELELAHVNAGGSLSR